MTNQATRKVTNEHDFRLLPAMDSHYRYDMDGSGKYEYLSCMFKSGWFGSCCSKGS